MPFELPPVDTPFESAIVMDLEASSEEWLEVSDLTTENGEFVTENTSSQQPDTGNQIGLSVSEMLIASELNRTSQNENLPSDFYASESNKPTTNNQEPTTDATIGSIEIRGPPTDSLYSPSNCKENTYVDSDEVLDLSGGDVLPQ
jgi:hypothetical protein